MIGRYRHITGAADDGVVSPVPCTLIGVVVGTEAATQTVAIHDCVTVGEVSADNLVSSLKLDARTSAAFDARMNAGLVAIVSGGAPDITVVYG